MAFLIVVMIVVVITILIKLAALLAGRIQLMSALLRLTALLTVPPYFFVEVLFRPVDAPIAVAATVSH